MFADADTVEATLFYPHDPEIVLEDLACVISKTFAATRVSLQRRLVSNTDLVIDVGGLTLTVTRSAAPLESTRFASARQGVLQTGLLRRHRAAIVIAVSGPAGVAKPATRLALCYIAATGMLGLARADLIHWKNTDVLATIAEFLQLRGRADSKTGQRRRVLETLGRSGPVEAAGQARHGVATQCTARPALAEEDPDTALRAISLPMPRDMKTALGQWMPTLKLQ